MSNPETNLLQNVRLAVGTMRGVVLFRNNIGQGWVGQVASHSPERLILLNPRPLQAGLVKGSGDLCGWRTFEIRQEHVGHQVAQFCSLEIKTTTGRVTPEQANFIRVVKAAGGLADIIRSAEEAKQILCG